MSLRIAPRSRACACMLPLMVGVALSTGVTGAQEAALAYKPPADERVPRRVGGNPRSGVASLPSTAVLAPDHLALTVSEQPTLYWYLSAPTSARIELTLVIPGREAPVVETIGAGERAGIQAFSPGVLGARLVPGVQYEWSVALVADTEQRSRDVFAAGAIMRVPLSAALAERLAASAPAAHAAAFAEEGIWYDAFAAISAQIEARPGDASLRAQRAIALERIGIADVAAFERRR